jgi:hypothetical protein
MAVSVVYDLQRVLSKFPKEVLDRYDFSNAVYTEALKPITGIVCPEHGEFKQYCGQLRKPGGAGCPACGDAARRLKQRLTQDQAIANMIETHKGKYDYFKTVYVRSADKITVTCPEHGDFVTTYNAHNSGRGCQTCGDLTRGHYVNRAEAHAKVSAIKIARHAFTFVAQARAIHGDTYDYSQVVYAGKKKKVTIICKKHGAFEQAPGHHIWRAHGCPECSHHRSKGEAAIFNFVSIFAEPASRDRATLGGKELDIHLVDHKLAIEYCGEYWHGASSVKEEQTARNRHLEKYEACKAKGIRLLTIYESEWLARPEAIKRLIRNAMGKSRGSIMARKCDLKKVDTREASTFYDKYHPQGGAGVGEHYGLFYSGKMVACMRFTFGVNDRGANSERVWTLSRYATSIIVRGGATRLMTAFIREYDPPTIKSFSDNRYFDGGMYEALGFTLEEVTAPDYQVYHQKIGLLPKSAWQRKSIPKRIKEIGSSEVFDPETDPRTERDMTFLLEAQRIFDCGKKRWTLTRH